MVGFFRKKKKTSSDNRSNILPPKNYSKIHATTFDPLSQAASLKFTPQSDTLVSGMSFSFVITPQAPDSKNQIYDSTGLQPNTEYSLQPVSFTKNKFFDVLFNQSRIREYFSSPRFYYEWENNQTVVTIRFFKSSFARQIDDPIYGEFRQKYSSLVTAQFSDTDNSCKLLESGVIVNQGGVKGIYYFDKDGKLGLGKATDTIKQNLIKDQRADIEKSNLLNQGVKFFDQGRYKEALQCYEKAHGVDPNDTNPVLLKGSMLAAMGQEKESMVCFDAILDADPDNHVALNNKGSALNTLGKPDEAIKCYDRALEIKPGYAKAYFNKGAISYHRNKFHEAREFFEKALATNPDYEKAIIWKDYAHIMAAMPSEHWSDSISVECPKCNASAQLTELMDREIDEKNPIDRHFMQNTDEIVYPELTHENYENLKFLDGHRYIAKIARMEPHSNKSTCPLSGRIFKVFYYFFIDHENKTAGKTFLIIDNIP